jgi:hypothetical protein
MRKWLWDVMLAAFIVFAFAFMVFSLSEKPVTGLSELYFQDYAVLPEVIADTLQVNFIAKNLEHKTTDYTAVVSAELFMGQKSIRNLTLDSMTFSLNHGDSGRFGSTYIMPKDFSLARIDVNLLHDEKNERISFWARSQAFIMPYSGLGNGSVECVTLENKVPTLERIEITASGTFARGFPVMAVWFDGSRLGEYEVKGSLKQEIFIGAKEGTHYLDIQFINDYYNSTTEEDRNLYIDQVFADQRPIKESLFDIGSAIKAFDCKGPAKGLSSEGSARYKIIVGDT